MNELNLSDEAIFDRLKKYVRSFLGANDKHLDEVNLSDNLKNDLGFDSLDSVELIMLIEREFGVNIGDNLETFQTVGDFFHYLKIALGRDSE